MKLFELADGLGHTVNEYEYSGGSNAQHSTEFSKLHTKLLAQDRRKKAVV